MSIISFCPNGGMEGILTSEKELYLFANLLEAEWADNYVPLPSKKLSEQARIIKTSSCTVDHEKDHNRMMYWERKGDGRHGWCCDNCGEVTQWS